MSKQLFVYTTLTSDNIYTYYSTETGNDVPAPIMIDGREGVLIAGGTGVANDRVITPRGVRTPVTEAQVEYLRANRVFQLHEKNGHIIVSDEDTDPEKIAANMEGRDRSAPIVPEELPEDEQPAATGAAEPIPAPNAPKAKRGTPAR